jgi:D-alanine-D-alanine ligase
MSSKKRVAIIFGGQSSEHEVSRVSAESVVKNINRAEYDVTMIGITRDGRWLTYDGPVEKLGNGEWQAIAESKAQKRLLEESISKRVDAKLDEVGNTALINSSVRNIFLAAGAEGGNIKIDVVFPVLHGCNGEDGTIQGLFELAGIPYVGSGVIGSAMGMDKGYAKIVFESEGIPQGKYLVFNRKQLVHSIDSVFSKVESTLTYPCFIKPSNAGSSVGVSKAHDREELEKALELAAKYDRRIIVEEFINGREMECGVLGNDEPIASIVGEIVPSNEFYDYRAKYIDNGSKAIIPADIPQETVDKIRYYAIKAFKALDCAGPSRVDFFVHKETAEIFINEINTLPGFTSISMYPQLWEASGVSYTELISRLIELAIDRHEDCKREIT